MKKYIIIMGLFSLFGCNEKKYSGSTGFIEIEKNAEISSTQAFAIYKSSFDKNFSVEKSPYDIDSFYQVIYIYNEAYYIGFANKNDKRNKEEAPLYFLAKINSKTGEISVEK
ncbi:hypothetical protein C1637_13765 [Chryseobacterium lactis]|uniref:DUF4377 domain-containing protein n=1 Tax=Chryseobacterium lactis TaxID=1241981 RepID=A0A3G6RJY4_CHRLC|nr:hypothetical protein [Chryseobacterium lactis]AZA83808.1 hypothetical protein EG342_18800 [Chryseobacterium lactis]AZB04193.1 hypothetical protein EG341_09675 [Chryseobacterium lactis]PNW12898.1 hypothetical protein C1637_13765 [Chryseobacterium lactis]